MAGITSIPSSSMKLMIRVKPPAHRAGPANTVYDTLTLAVNAKTESPRRYRAMRSKKVYVNKGEECFITVVFVPEEFTADAAGAKEARETYWYVTEKKFMVEEDCIQTMPGERVEWFGQKRAAHQP